MEITDKNNDRLMTVGFAGLAAILNKTEKTVRRLSAEAPERLPPSLPGFRPRTWRLITVEEWLDKLEGRLVQQARGSSPVVFEGPLGPPRRGPGRPRKGG